MGQEKGWIIDAHVEGSTATLWIKTVDDRILKVRDVYSPSFYIAPKTLDDGERIASQLIEHPHVTRVEWEEKYVTLESQEKRRLLHIILDSTKAYRKLKESLSKYAKEYYNTSLLHIQKYVFENLKIAPTCKVELEKGEDSFLKHIRLLDDEWEIFPPPLKTLYFKVNLEGYTYNINKPIKSIEAEIGEHVKTISGEEKDVLEELSNLIIENDPDIIVCPECETTIEHIHSRANLLGLKFIIGREYAEERKPYWVKGRTILDQNFMEEFGLAGLLERCRFSLLPAKIACRWSANRIIDSRICYELTNMGYAIPETRGKYEYVRSLGNVIERDKGGIILPPKVGVHENVAELDFESQYPHIIVKYGISYETIKPNEIKFKDNAILPNITRKVLERRLYFKRLRKTFPKDRIEYKYCEQRQKTLKYILVTLYGTSGCCWNRWGNVLAFEEINRKSREIMIKSIAHVQSLGYKILYADCDSIFIKKENSTKEDYEKVAEELTKITGIPMTLDHHYKFIALLPQESRPKLEAQKHYYGILYDGEIVARGIELRKQDTPKYIKELQTKMIKTLLDCKNIQEVYKIGYNKTIQIVKKAIEDIKNNKIPAEELTISKTLRKPLQKYKSMQPHVSAAKQLLSRGEDIKPGSIIKYTYTNTKHHNPICRIKTIPYNGKINVDKRKYIKMTISAMKTILSPLESTKEANESKTLTKEFFIVDQLKSYD